PGTVEARAHLRMLYAFAHGRDAARDASGTRRGTRPAHVESGDQHEANGWRGEARRFGEGVAILIGDVAHVYADVLLGDVPADAAMIWNELRLELNVGQHLDLMGTARADRDPALARRRARSKSGKDTVTRPLPLAA